MMKQQGELVAGNCGDGVRVDIARYLRVTDPDHGELLRNTDPGDGVVEDGIQKDVSAIRYLQPVFASAWL